MSTVGKLLNSIFSLRTADGKVFTTFRRYLVVGFCSFGLEYTLFFLLYHVSKVGYITANSSAIFIVFWLNFFLNRCWTFKSKQSLRKQLPPYAFIFFFNIGLTNLLMFLGVYLIGLIPLFSKFATMGIIVIWNFLFYTKVVYRD